MINARFQMMYKINGRIENEEAFIGDDGWMFEKSKTVNIPSIEKQREKIEKDAKILKKLADKFKGKNISIYLVLMPDRETLYRKYWENYYEPKSKLDYGEEIIKLIQNTPNIKVIYPKEEFKKYSSIEPLYMKIDQHLTFIGASIFRKKVFDTLKEDFFAHQNFTYEIIPPTNYKSRGIANMLGIRYNKYEGEKSFFVKDIKFAHTPFEVTVAGKLREADQVWPAFEMTTNKNPIHKSNLFVLGGCAMQGANRLFAPIKSSNPERKWLFWLWVISIKKGKNWPSKLKHNWDSSPL